MNRMTSDNTFEMDMHQLALNQVYVREDGWAQYVKNPEEECSVCDLIRTAAETLGVEIPVLSDEDLSDLLTDWLQYGEEEPEGVLAILYRALCAMEEVRARLFAYEDTGLMPEEIKAVQEAMEPIPFGRFRDIMEAERAGRLVLSPELNGLLALDELREIPLMEWVWIEITHPNARQRFCKIKSAYYQVFDDYTDGEALCCGWPGVIHEFEYDDYGKTWLAYRHKPEEGMM